MRRKVQDVAHRGGAERVDRLGVVAHHREAAAVRLEPQQDRGLQPVGVLVFVDQDVVEALRDIGRERGLGHHLRPIEQQIVVIEHVLVLLGLHIGGEQRAQLGLPFGAPGKARAQHGLERLLEIDRAGIDRQAGAFQGEALLGTGIAQLVADQIHQIGAVLAIVDREGAIEPDALGIFAQQPGADRVEGAGEADGIRHGAGALAHDIARNARDPPLHLGRGPARERQQHHAARIGAVDDEMRDPVRQRVGLARPRPGDDQERSRLGEARGAMLHGAKLRCIEGRVMSSGHRPRRSKRKSLESNVP